MIAPVACRHCNREWFAEYVRGPAPLYCEPCRPAAYREASKARNQAYRATNRDKLRANARARYAGDPVAARNNQLKIKYGITQARFDAILVRQGGGCAICHRRPSEFTKRFHVDHDHACCPGMVTCGGCLRGLLCHHCNAQLVAGYEKLPAAARTWEAMNVYLAGQIERDPWLQGGSD